MLPCPKFKPPEPAPPDLDRELAEALIQAMRLRRMLGPDTAAHLIRHQGDTSWRVQIELPKGGAR